MKTPNFMFVTLAGLILLLGLAGCSKDGPVQPSEDQNAGDTALRTSEAVLNHPDAPSGLVDVTWQGQRKTFWPYTGTNLSGVGQDPINLVFVGADPVQIRAALLALDGDRSGIFPDVFPLNATWSDAIGNPQTGYVEDDGWTGAVVQLQLGAYDPLRFHIRMIRCGGGPMGDGDGGSRVSQSSGQVWTIANAHMDMIIPLTPEHQVISWELAEQIVAYDLVRTGLLHPSSLPPGQTGIINEAPDFRAIPETIYDGMPDGLKVLVGLPPGPADEDVPLPNDGMATILHLATNAPVVAGTSVQSLTVNFDRMVPKPFCSDGPLDLVFLQGPLSLTQTVTISGSGRYQYTSGIDGELTAMYIDVTQNPPVPVGDPFFAHIRDRQQGITGDRFTSLRFDSKRGAPQPDGMERLMEKLIVSTAGQDVYRWRTQCIE